MSTKYIVNNVTGQTINGSLTINGNVTITGTSNSNGIATYKALLTQTGSIVATYINDLNGALIIGETYTITDYKGGDDFINIANVQSGNINETGCVFIATGETPNIWSNGSQLTSLGNLIVDVLENTLGFDIDWVQAPFGGYGYYIGFNSEFGPFYNQFPRNNTEVKVQSKYPFNFGPPFSLIPIAIPGVSSTYNKDSTVYIDMYYDGDLTDEALYYTPVEINIKQDLDVTPIVLSGTVTSSYPFYNASVDIYCGSQYIDSFYSAGQSVNSLAELVSYLNTDPTTSRLGIYSYDVSENIFLTMKTNLKNQFCADNTLTFEVYND